jgi:carbon storage regulator
MLVVSRRPGQSILVGPDIEVVVLEVEGNQVRIGINAPRAVRILRRELHVQVERENRRSVDEGNATPETLGELADELRARPDLNP